MLAALTASACETGQFRATEPLTDESIRIAATFAGSESGVHTLAGTEPLRVSLASVFARDDPLEVWVFGYRGETVARTFPELAGSDARAMADAIDPRLDGQGPTQPPPPDQVLWTQVTTDGPRHVEYETKDWTDWLAEVTAGRRPPLTFGRSPSTSCTWVRTQTIAPPSGYWITRITALSDREAIIAGDGPDPDAMAVGKVQGSTLTMLAPDPRIGPTPVALASDGRASLYGVSASAGSTGARAFRLDAEARWQGPVDLAGGMQSPKGVSIGQDGSVFFFSDDGLFELAPNTDRADQRPDLAMPVEKLHVVSRERIVALSVADVHVLDGDGWNREHVLGSLNQIHSFGGDELALVAVGPLEVVLVRDEHTRAWKEWKRPADRGHHLRSVVGLGGGQYLVAGNKGLAAIWNGERWCQIADTPNTSFWTADRAPSADVVFAIGRVDQTATEAAIVRFDLDWSRAGLGL